ncbi:MAG: glycosyltransferase [Myxococcaceae bacterium]|nr:glycosyltransferase [Myxococcaceae bacterium]
MRAGSRVVVVVPAKNESTRIARVVTTLPSWVDRVLVVDDASTDGTAEHARATGDARVRVIVHPENRGVGAAIVSGYRAALDEPGARDDAFVVMAGDAQMDPDDLPRVVDPIAHGEAGYVKGNRFASPEVWRAMPLARRLGGEVLSRLTTRAIGVSITDSQCGYTAIARWACEAIDLDQVFPRYGYPNDLLGLLARKKIPIREVVVRPVYAGEASGLRAWHVARIGAIVARAWAARIYEERRG